MFNTELIELCLCINCEKMMADCGDPKHPGWYCYWCSIERISQVKGIDMIKARVAYDYGKYKVDNDYQVIELEV